MSNRFFVVVAHARSGSTLVCKTISDQFDGRVFLEIFHQELDVILDHLFELADPAVQHFEHIPRDQLREYLARNPTQLKNFLLEHAEGEDTFCKVFPGHLQLDALSDLLAETSGVVILHRNPLHSFISNQIASGTNKWRTVDTSGEKVSFSPSEFERYIRQMASFYESVGSILERHGTPRVDINYELFFSSNRVKQFVEQLAPLKLNSSIGDGSFGEDLVRQDRRISASSKVSNPEELLNWLEEKKLIHVDDGTVPVSFNELVRVL